MSKSSREDAAWASHVLKLPSVALLTTAGPGSMASSMEFFLAGQAVEEVKQAVETFEPGKACRQRLREAYGIDLDLVSGLETFGYLQSMTLPDLVLMTTTEDLQDPVPPKLLERYEEKKVSFVGVGPLLDQNGARRAAGHKFQVQVARQLTKRGK